MLGAGPPENEHTCRVADLADAQGGPAANLQGHGEPQGQRPPASLCLCRHWNFSTGAAQANPEKNAHITHI
eukprot:scaffold658955_cov66-Prasinocladus_malaysianus.AAC.1